MLDPETQLIEKFCCGKCRGRKAVARTASIGGLPTLLNLGADKYILVSCTLCGYTEIYNTHAFAVAAEDETELESRTVPQQS
jgi:predicted nucleic-acid-binding Zn-ribbon protein